MTKYEDPQTYIHSYVEAGHVGQNIMLIAAREGMTVIPTSLIWQPGIEAMLGLDRIRQAGVYALGVGWPAPRPSTDDPAYGRALRGYLG
jgi:nitroreductase